MPAGSAGDSKAPSTIRLRLEYNTRLSSSYRGSTEASQAHCAVTTYGTRRVPATLAAAPRFRALRSFDEFLSDFIAAA